MRVERCDRVRGARLNARQCGTHRARLTRTLGARQMSLTELLAVTDAPGLAGLVIRVPLADMVFAEQIGSAAVGGGTEMAFASKCAGAGRRDIRIQWDFSEVGQRC